MQSDESSFTCPKCGSLLFHRSYRTGGWWKQLVEFREKDPFLGGSNFEVVDTCLDGVKLGLEPKTITCAECSHRVKNPDFKQ